MPFQWRHNGSWNYLVGVHQMNEPRITKLPRNGPKLGQSVAAWLYGKSKSDQAALERLRWEQVKHNKKAP